VPIEIVHPPPVAAFTETNKKRALVKPLNLYLQILGETCVGAYCTFVPLCEAHAFNPLIRQLFIGIRISNITSQVPKIKV